MWWRFLIIFLTYALLAAHFLRYSHTLMAALFALAPLLLCIRHPSSIRVLQLGLIMGVLFVWGPSTYDYIQMRQAVDAPWIRLLVIMLGVMCLNFYGAYIGNHIIKYRQN